MKLSDEIILKIVDTFDETSKLYYNVAINEEKDNTSVTNYNIYVNRTNYYECLLKMIDYYLGKIELDIEVEVQSKIDSLFDELDNKLEGYALTNEEMRRALLLLDINGFKHLNFPLDYITPDVIGTICTYLISNIYTDKINILDFNFGVGNLAFYVANNLNIDVNLFGVENHSLLVDVSAHKADIMEQDLILYHQDALEVLPKDMDVIISDIASNDYENANYHSKLYDEGVRYFPYLAIERYLDLENDPLYIYIIDNNFFQKEGADKFKEMLNEKGQILALIALPTNFFLSELDTKSILVLKKKKEEGKNLGSSVYVLPKIEEKEAFMKTIVDIVEHIKNNI